MNNFTTSYIVYCVKLNFTSIVWDWCMDLMADWAICLAVNVTNAQPESEKHNISRFMQSIQRKNLFWQNFRGSVLVERILADIISSLA